MMIPPRVLRVLLVMLAGVRILASEAMTDEDTLPVPESTPSPSIPIFDEPGSLLDDFAVSRWLAEDGLPEDVVNAMTFTSDGYLWCLTDKTLSRFDGLHFEVLSREVGPSGAGWSGLCETGGDTLWVCGSQGAVRFGPNVMGTGIWEGTHVPAGTPVLRVFQGADNVLWAVGSNGVYRMEGHKPRFFELPRRVPGQGVQVDVAAMAADGQIWLAAGWGVLRFAKGKVEAEPAFGGAIRQLSMGRGGSLWVATDTNLYLRTGNRWQSIPEPPHRNHPRWRITTLMAVDAGELWVGTTSGLCRWRDKAWSVLSPRDGFYPLEIRCITRDPEGNIWAGSSGGLLRLRRKAVQVYDSGLVLRRHTFTAVLPEPGLGLRVGVAGGGLLEGAPGSFRPYGQAPVSRTAVISALLKARDGALWIGTQGDYLWRCAGGRAECITDPFPGEDSAVNINALLEDRQGRIWAGTGNGVMLYDPGKSQLEPFPGLTAVVRVHALVEDLGGAIWVGLQGEGVARISKDGNVARFRQEQGLPANTVMALCVDADGVLWAGTIAGLGRWDGTQWSAITERQGLPEGPLVQLLEEGPNLWVGSRYGVARLSRSELAEVVAGGKMLLVPQPFGRNEGMREEQCSSGFGNLAAKDGDGRLWFSTLDGLVMVDPRRIAKNPGGRRVFIDEIRIGQNVVTSIQQGLAHDPLVFSVPPGSGRITIRYSAPYFSAPDQVQFKRMLEGVDLAWSVPTGARAIMYPKLPPGNYRFRVTAGVGGVWREASQTVDFVVMPFLWERWWFWIVTGSFALALVGLWVRAAEKQRSRRRFMELERQQALERERSRIAHDLHDDLGASLTEIGLIGAVAQRPTVTPERARHYLGEITEKVRSMVDTLDEIVWAINPRNDTVTSLGDYFCECAQRMLQLTPIRCRLDLAPELPARPLDPDRRHNLFLAFSEALNNVIRHSGATEALIRIAVVGGALEVTVEDNGRGLAKGPVSEGAEGLKSMRRRLERMGGRCVITSRDGLGTVVRFIVPLE